jgi:hypothetical protein
MKKTAIVSILATAASANAATVMITPTAATYTNSPNQEETGYPLANENNIINGSGLSAAPTVANVATVTHDAVLLSGSGNAWATIDTGAGGGDFYAQGGNAPVFTFNLGGSYSVTDFAIWGYHFNGNNANHPKNITLEFSLNGGGSFGTPVNIVVPNAGAFNSADVVNFSAQTADFVRMTVTDNYFGSYAGGDRVGIAEVRFMGDAVPEPGVTLLGAIGSLALLGRRRR